MKLSNQAMGAIMMALQKSLLEQSDIVPTLKGFDFEFNENEQLVVKNPPSFMVKEDTSSSELTEENHNTTGSD